MPPFSKTCRCDERDWCVICCPPQPQKPADPLTVTPSGHVYVVTWANKMRIFSKSSDANNFGASLGIMNETYQISEEPIYG